MKTHTNKKRVTWEMDKVKGKGKGKSRKHIVIQEKIQKQTEENQENPRFPIFCDCLFTL